ncbi:MAG TPA: BamA/TamA family outer membrane protein [Polyangiaceae bacterium]|nr:BamA/TamA family outer membrane protein [Polyangiaceae bacterium]
MNGEERQRPDYDGRDNVGTDAGDVLRWIPRVVLYPVYLVMEYGLRVPVVWTITRIEEYQIADRVSDFFTWDNGRGSLFPLVSFDFGIRPNVGLVFKWTEFAPRHDASATFFVGPDDLWSGKGSIDQKLFRDEEALIRWSGSYVRRPDNVFYGISDLTDRCNQLARGCRFRSAIAEARLALVGWEKKLSQVELSAGYRHARFSTDSDGPPLTEAEAAQLPGFVEGYQILEPRLEFALDSRDEDLDFHTGTGLRFDGKTAFAVDVGRPDERWWRAGGEASAFYDLGFGQVLATSLYYEGILNLGSHDANGQATPIPFFELPYLGGQEQMKGFLRRRLIGYNAWAANFEYHYPITWGLDAAMFASVGNTYEDLGDWNLIKNYLSYGLSLKLAQDRVSSFEGILAWGSNRMDEPAFDPFNQFRFSAGINKGF